MHYSNTTTIRSRAGLVVLILALIISLVSAAPIQTAESGLSSSTTFSPTNINPSPKGHPDVDAASLKIPISGRMSILPGALSPRDISTDMDDQLVRRSIASKIRDGFKKAGQAIAHVAKKVASGVKSVVNKVATGVKTAAKKVETGVKTAVKKVGNFVKTTGATVAKFGLKVYQSVGEVVGKVASFVPGIGKPVQQAIHAATTVAGFASDHIKAKLPPKLQKGMDVMNKANKIMKYIPRDLVSEEEESFQQRDVIGDAYSSYFQERDDVEFLENREESYLEVYERDIIYERDLYELYDDMD